MKYTDTLKNQRKIFNRKDLKKTVRIRIQVKSFNNNKGIEKSHQKSIAIIIKYGLKCKNGRTYSFSCEKFTCNIQEDKKIMRNKVIREKQRCFNCNHNKSNSSKQPKKVNIKPPRIFHQL